MCRWSRARHGCASWTRAPASADSPPPDLPPLQVRGQAQWSPDGTRLVVVGLQDRHLYILDTARPHVRRIPLPAVYRVLLP